MDALILFPCATSVLVLQIRGFLSRIVPAPAEKEPAGISRMLTDAGNRKISAALGKPAEGRKSGEYGDAGKLLDSGGSGDPGDSRDTGNPGGPGDPGHSEDTGDRYNDRRAGDLPVSGSAGKSSKLGGSGSRGA